jgi:cerevisin
VNAMTYTYLYTQPAGDGVDIYVLDTGVYPGHSEFQGRATFGWAAPGYLEVDGEGHGTHIAGIAAGRTYGVAKNANIIAVRVVDDKGNADKDELIAGLNYVAANVRSTGRPSIACMAINGPYSLAFNEAAAVMIRDGVSFVVSAVKDGEDASNNSPASVVVTVVVGSSDITNTMSPTSNFGPHVDVFAPGVAITSAGINGPFSTQIESGTSQAAAHVAGLAAYFLSKEPTMKPSAIKGHILALATENIITGTPPNTDTDNDLVYNDADDD